VIYDFLFVFVCLLVFYIVVGGSRMVNSLGMTMP
jgi:hypothetical protein